VHAGPAHDEVPAGGGAATAAAVTATGSAGGSIRFGPSGTTSSAGTATAAPISGLPADPMKTAREVPGDAAASGGVRQGFTPSGARIGRNDPCWCGSGQKYKKCHGA
jgi:preprotein translocase subunit SecA